MEKSNLNADTIRINSVKFHWSNKNDFKIYVPEFNVARGEKVLLLGESGSGKTTLLSLICCLLYTSPSPRDRTRSRMPSSA